VCVFAFATQRTDATTTHTAHIYCNTNTRHTYIYTHNTVCGSLVDILNLPREHQAVGTDRPSDLSPAEHCKKKKRQPPISKETTTDIKRDHHRYQKRQPMISNKTPTYVKRDNPKTQKETTKDINRDNQRDQNRPRQISKETHVDPWTTRHTGWQRLKGCLKLHVICVAIRPDLDSSPYCVERALLCPDILSWCVSKRIPERGLYRVEMNYVSISPDFDSSPYCIGQSSSESSHIVLVCL